MNSLPSLYEEVSRLFVKLREHPVVVLVRRSFADIQMALLLCGRVQVHVHGLVYVVLHRVLDIVRLNSRVHKRNLPK